MDCYLVIYGLHKPLTHTLSHDLGQSGLNHLADCDLSAGHL